MTEYSINARNEGVGEFEKVRVGDLTDKKNIFLILKTIFENKESLIKVLSTQFEYKKRFFNEETDLDEVFEE